MNPRSARVLLRFCRASPSSALALVMLLPLADLACLLPPDDALGPAAINYPPEIDLETLSPPEPLLPVSLKLSSGSDCSFKVTAVVIDRNHETLLYRFVADNRTRSRTLLNRDDDELRLRDGTGLAQFRLQPNRDFVAASPGPRALSLFVTDGAEWALEEKNIDASEETDLGKIVVEDPGPSGPRVVEARWVFDLVDRFDECPQ